MIFKRLEDVRVAMSFDSAASRASDEHPVKASVLVKGSSGLACLKRDLEAAAARVRRTPAPPEQAIDIGGVLLVLGQPSDFTMPPQHVDGAWLPVDSLWYTPFFNVVVTCLHAPGGGRIYKKRIHIIEQ